MHFVKWGSGVTAPWGQSPKGAQEGIACLEIQCIHNMEMCKCIMSLSDQPALAPGSSSGGASTLGSGCCRFESRPRHTKGVKNGANGYLAWHSAL